MSNKIDLEQKINDYNTLIELLEKKKGLVEAGMETVEVDRLIESYKLGIEIREKTKYRDQLIPLLVQENQKLDQQLQVVNDNFPKVIEALNAKLNEMSPEDQQQYLGIRKLHNEGGWISDIQRIQGYRILITYVQKYGVAEGNDSNEDSE